MSKRWKVVTGVIVVLVIVGCVGLPIAGTVFFRDWVRRQDRGPGMMHRRESEEVHHALAVELVDDDEDGVPDRGVIEVPMGGEAGFGRGRFAHFGPGRGMGFGRRVLAPFLAVRGSIHLALLAGLILLGVALYRSACKVQHQSTATEPET